MADLSAYYAAVNGGGVLDTLEDLVKNNVRVVLGLLVVLVILVIYLLWTRKEGMMPMVQNQEQDQIYVGGGTITGPPKGYIDGSSETFRRSEGAEDGAPVVQPGSLSYQVLNSPDFGCSGRVPWQGDSAWAWMSQASRAPVENAEFGGYSGNQLSMAMIGGSADRAQ